MQNCAGSAFFNRCRLLHEAISAIENNVAAVSSFQRRRNESAVSIVVVIMLVPSGASVADANILHKSFLHCGGSIVQLACVTYKRLADL